MSQSDSFGFELYQPLPSLGEELAPVESNLAIKHNVVDSAYKKYVEQNTTMSDKLAMIQDVAKKKELELSGFEIVTANMSDPDSGAVTAQGRKFRFSEPDALDSFDQANKSPFGMQLQKKQVADLYGVLEDNVTPSMWENAKNYQYNEFLKGFSKIDTPFEEFSRDKVYSPVDLRNTPVEMAIKPSGRFDKYGREFVEAINPRTGRRVSFDMGVNPYLSARNSKEGFDFYTALQTSNNGELPIQPGRAFKPKDKNTEFQIDEEALNQVREGYDTNSRLGEDLDIMQSSAYQTAARVLQYGPEFLVDKEKWARVANPQTGQALADAWAEVKPSTRKDFAKNMLDASNAFDKGDYVDAIVGWGSQMDRLFSESTTQMGLIAAGTAITGGAGLATSIGAKVGSQVVGKLAAAFIGATGAGIDKTLSTIEDFKVNNGRDMTKAEVAEAFALNTATLIPESFLLGANFARLLPKGVSTALTKAYAPKALATGAKTITASTLGEFGQEASEDVVERYLSQNQSKPESFANLLLSKDTLKAGIIGGMMGGTLSGVASGVATGINLRRERVTDKTVSEANEYQSTHTNVGAEANTELSQSIIDKVKSITPTQFNTSQDTIQTIRNLETLSISPDISEQANDSVKAKKAELTRNAILQSKSETDTNALLDALGQSREEAFEEQVYYSNLNSARFTTQNNGRKASKSTIEETTKQLEETGKKLGLSDEVVKEKIEAIQKSHGQVDLEVKYGSSGYNTYINQINLANEGLQRTDLTAEERTNLQKRQEDYGYALGRLYNNQLKKLNAFVNAARKIATGNVRNARVQYPSGSGQGFDLIGEYLANNTYESGHSAYGMVRDLDRDIDTMGAVLNSLPKELKTFLRNEQKLQLDLNINSKALVQAFKDAATNIRNEVVEEVQTPTTIQKVKSKVSSNPLSPKTLSNREVIRDLAKIVGNTKNKSSLIAQIRTLTPEQLTSVREDIQKSKINDAQKESFLEQLDSIENIERTTQAEQRDLSSRTEKILARAKEFQNETTDEIIKGLSDLDSIADLRTRVKTALGLLAKIDTKETREFYSYYQGVQSKLIERAKDLVSTSENTSSKEQNSNSVKDDVESTSSKNRKNTPTVDYASVDTDVESQLTTTDQDVVAEMIEDVTPSTEELSKSKNEKDDTTVIVRDYLNEKGSDNVDTGITYSTFNGINGYQYNLNKEIVVSEPTSTLGGTEVDVRNPVVKNVLTTFSKFLPNFRSTGQLLGQRFNESPSLRLLYDFMIDLKSTTARGHHPVKATLRSNVAMAIDLGFKEYFRYANLWKMQNPFTPEEVGAIFGIPKEQMDSNKTVALKTLVNSHGLPKSYLANEIGKTILENLGIRPHSGTNTLHTYEKIAAGLGSTAFDYAQEQGWVTLTTFDIPEGHVLYSQADVHRLPMVKFNIDGDRIRELFSEVEFLKVKSGNTYTKKPLTKPKKELNKVVRHTSGLVNIPKFTQGVMTKLLGTPYVINRQLVSRITKDDATKANVLARMGWMDEVEIGKLPFEQQDGQRGINHNVEDQYNNLVNLANENDPKYFYDWFFSSNGRVFINSNDVNPQTQKTLQRFLVLPEAVEQEFDPNSSIDVDAMNFAIAQAFDAVKSEKVISDIGTAVASYENIEGMLDDLINLDEDTFVGKYKSLGIDSIENFGQALNVLEHVKLYQQNLESGTKFKTWLAIENDSTTSGYAIRFLQFPNAEFLSKWGKKVGIDDTDTKGMEIHSLKEIKGFLDIYKTMASATAKLLPDHLRDRIDVVAAAQINTKQKNIGEHRKKIAAINKSLVDNKDNPTVVARLQQDKSTQELAITKIENEIKLIRNEALGKSEGKGVLVNYATYPKAKVLTTLFTLMNDALPKPESDGSVGSKLRKLLKPPAMTFGYTAGQRSITTSLAKNIYTDMSTRYVNLIKSKATQSSLEKALTNAQTQKDIAKAQENLSIFSTFQYIEKNLLKNKDTTIYDSIMTQNSDRIKLNYSSPNVQIGDGKTSLEALFIDLLVPTYGKAVWDSLEASFADTIEYNDSMNVMFNSMFTIFEKEYNKGLEKLVKAHPEGVPLKEHDDLVKSLFNFLPMIKLVYSSIQNKLEDGSISLEGALVISTEKQVDNKPNSPTRTSTMSYYDLSENKTDIKSHTTQAYVQKFINAGKAGAVLPIHFIDGMAMTLLLNKYGNEMIPVHDASVMSALRGKEITQEYNKILYTLNKDYDLFNTIVERFTEIITAYEKIDPTIREHLVTSLGQRDSRTIKQLLVDIGKLNRTNQIARDEFRKTTPYITNMDGIKGSGYQTTGNESLDDYILEQPEIQALLPDELKSNPNSLTVGQTTELLNSANTSTKARVGLFKELQNIARSLGNKVENQDHLDYLETLVGRLNTEHLDNVDTQWTTSEATTGSILFTEPNPNQVTKGARGTITLAYDNQTSQQLDSLTRLSPYSGQSVAEIYAHELIHAGIRFGLANATSISGMYKTIQQLRTIQRRASEVVTEDDFMPDTYDPNLESYYRDNAKTIWNYIFANQDTKGDRGLQEFVSYGMTNEKVMRKLKQHKLVVNNKPARLLDRLIALGKAILDVAFGKEKFGDVFTLTYEVIKGNMSVKQKNDLYTELSILHGKIDNANNRAANSLLDTPRAIFNRLFSLVSWLRENGNSIIIPRLRYLGNIFDIHGYPSSWQQSITGTKWDDTKLLVKTALRLFFSQSSRKAMKIWMNEVCQFSQQGVAMSLLRDLTEPDMQSSRLELISLLTRYTDTISKGLENTTRLDLIQGFDRELREEEQVSITKSVLMTDLSSLLDDTTDIDTVKEWLGDAGKRDVEIQRLENTLHSTGHGMWYINQSKGLANFMVTNLGNERQNLNATNIAKGYLSGSLIQNVTEDTINAIDKLTTLYAIDYSDNNFNTIAANLDSKGLENILTIHKQFVKETKEGQVLNGKLVQTIDDIHVIKGYTKQLLDPSLKVQIDFVDRQKDLEKAGYKLVQHLKDNKITKGPDMAIYIRTFSPPTRRDSAGFILSGTNTIGTALMESAYQTMGFIDPNAPSKASYAVHQAWMREANLVGENIRKQMLSRELTKDEIVKMSKGYTPIPSQTGIADYRITMNNSTKEKLLNPDMNGITVLSKMFAQANTKASAVTRNKVLIDFLEKDMQNNMLATHYNTDGFKYIKMTPDTHNEYLKESWNIIPQVFKDKIKEYNDNGDGFWVREDWLASLMGVPSVSISDNKTVIKYTNLTSKRLISLAEYIIKTIALVAKQNIVVRIPRVLIGNVISNLGISVANGTNPAAVLKSTINNAANMRDYIDTKKELNRLEFRQRVGTATQSEINNIPWHKAKLEHNPLHPLMIKGMYQSIVEDINPEELESTNKIIQFLKNTKIAKKIPGVVKTIGRQSYMTEGTPIYDFMFMATQYSDFIARATEYQFRMAKAPEQYEVVEVNGKKVKRQTQAYTDFEEKITISVLNTFINYDKPQSAKGQYLNDIGLVMFSKFGTRIQHVINKGLVENPVGTLFFLLGQTYLANTEDIYEQHWAFKSWSALGHDPMDNLITAATPMLLREWINPLVK